MRSCSNQPRRVVTAHRQPHPAQAPGRRLRAARPRGAGAGRHNRAALGAAGQGARHLSRPGALVRQPLRRDQRLALDEPDAAGVDPMGGSGRCPSSPHFSPPSVPAADASGATSPCSMSAVSSPCRRAAGCRDATSCLSVTAASPPCCSSTSFLCRARRRSGVTAVTRLRLDAALYEPAPPDAAARDLLGDDLLRRPTRAVPGRHGPE